MSGCLEKQRMEAMAISFEEQLSIVYPQGPSFFRAADAGAIDSDENKGSDSAKEVSLFRDSLQNVIDDLTYPSDFEEFKKAMTMAIHKWKSKTENNNTTTEGGNISAKTSTGTGKTFSLLDQLQGGFAMPVSFEEIQEAGSMRERLQVFQKIKYLEDLSMDWSKIGPLLINDLSESFVADSTLSLQLIDLHRKWFHQGRSSSEYTPLLFGICENLLRTLKKIVSLEETKPIEDASRTKQKTIMVSLVQNWRDMWLDLMQRDQYSIDLAGHIEKCMLELFLGPGSSEAALLAKKVLVSVDPSAAWFQSWVNHVSTNDNLIALLRDTKTLPLVWTQLRAFRDISGRNANDSLIQFHAAAILSITLCRTRLSHFPCDAFTNSNSTEDSETTMEIEGSMDAFQTVIDEMLDLFLNAVVLLSIDEKNNDESSRVDLMICTLLNGIEAILAGSRNDIDSEVDRRYKRVESCLQEQNEAINDVLGYFLKTQLRR